MDEIQEALSRLQQPTSAVEDYVAKIQFLTSVSLLLEVPGFCHPLCLPCPVYALQQWQASCCVGCAAGAGEGEEPGCALQ